MKHRVILDLCAGSGAWSEPYRAAGYTVRRLDLPTDVRLIPWESTLVHGILAAPPCTCFSYARNRYPASAAELQAALSVVDACLRAVVVYKPSWWALENPRARLREFLGPPAFEFRQWEFGDDAEKPTALWGQFTAPRRAANGQRRKPSTFKTSKENALVGDAVTPTGFAEAFFKANP